MNQGDKRIKFAAYCGSAFERKAKKIRDGETVEPVDVFARGEKQKQDQYERTQYEGLATFVLLASDDLKKKLMMDTSLAINNVEKTCTDKEWIKIVEGPQFRHSKAILYNFFYKQTPWDHHSKKTDAEPITDF